MLNAPPPSPSVSSINQQGNQLLNNPNSRSLQTLQNYARMGQQMPGTLTTPGAPAMWPHGGFASMMPALSQNPLAQSNMPTLLRSLRGG